MVAAFFSTGSRWWLPVVLLSLGSGLFAGACSKPDSPELNAQSGLAQEEAPANWAATSAAQNGTLWDTPDLPQPLHLTVDGQEVLGEVVEAFLMEPWSSHCAAEGFGLPVEKLSATFFTKPEDLFQPLVRGVVLLREAERRFPELDSEQLAHFQQQMEQAVGTALDSLKKRYGEDGWRRHIERQWRLRLLKADFSALSPEVLEEDVYAYYDQEILSQLPTLEQHEGEDISYATLSPQLRRVLEENRATETQEAWLDEQMEGRSVSVHLPTGDDFSWVEHAP